MLLTAGHLSSQMLVHILLMNAVAPLIALALRHRWLTATGLRGRLFLAMSAQLVLLWAWHSPPALDAVSQSPIHHLAMQASLLICATWFWSAVFFVRDDGRWKPIVALLLTSKMFCLLGVLLVFAPRVLYPNLLSAHGGHVLPATLADQQLAGLLMLVACPATYVLAGVVIAARWFGDMDAADAAHRPPEARRAV
jgi:putative membrane protein